MKKIIIWGAAGQLMVLAEFINSAGFEIAAVFDNDFSVDSPLDGAAVYHGQEQLLKWRAENYFDPCFFSVAVGGWKGKDRLNIHQFLIAQGLKPASLVHPRAFVASNARIGRGCQILAGACVGARAELGDQVIINTGAGVDHECVVSEGAHIAPGAVLAGGVTVRRNSFVGAGSVVLPGVTIGSDVIIGAGSVVTKNCPDGVVAFGSPCRVKRKNTYGGPPIFIKNPCKDQKL